MQKFCQQQKLSEMDLKIFMQYIFMSAIYFLRH